MDQNDPTRIARRAATALAATCLLDAAPCHANVPLPAMMAHQPTLALGLGFLLLAAGVIVIEAVAIKAVSRLPMRRAFRYALLINVVTTGIGIVLMSPGLGLFAVLLVVTGLTRFNLGWGVGRSWLAGLTVAGVYCYGLMPAATIPGQVLKFYLVFALAFLLTLLVEWLLLCRYGRRREAWRWAITANAGSYAVLLALLLAGGFRSGAAAEIEWLVHRWHQRSEPTEATIVQLGEIYQWRESGRPFLATFGRERTDYPYWELRLVSEWAQDGHEDMARRLYDLAARHHRPAPDDPQWREARLAIAGEADRE